MFGDSLEKAIKELLDVMTIEELLEYNGLTVEETIELLMSHGYVDFPEFMKVDVEEEDLDSE